MILAKKILSIAALAAMFVTNGLAAQEPEQAQEQQAQPQYRLPGQHSAEHGTLIAHQDYGTVEAPNTMEYIDQLFS